MGMEQRAKLVAYVLSAAMVAGWIWGVVHLVLVPAPRHPHERGDMRFDVFAR